MRCNHVNEGFIEKAGQRSSVMHSGLVSADNPVVVLGISFRLVARYDPIEYLVRSCPYAETRSIETMITVQHYAIAVAFTERRRIPVRGIVVEEGFEACLREFGPRIFWICRPDDVPEHLRCVLLEQFEFARRERNILFDQPLPTTARQIGRASCRERV